MLVPFVALVMVPFVIPHAYVPPVTAVMLAVRPTTFGQLEAFAVMGTLAPEHPVVVKTAEYSDVPLDTVVQPAPLYEVAVVTIPAPAVIAVVGMVKLSFESGVVRQTLPSRVWPSFVPEAWKTSICMLPVEGESTESVTFR